MTAMRVLARRAGISNPSQPGTHDRDTIQPNILLVWSFWTSDGDLILQKGVTVTTISTGKANNLIGDC